MNYRFAISLRCANNINMEFRVFSTIFVRHCSIAIRPKLKSLGEKKNHTNLLFSKALLLYSSYRLAL